MLGTMHRIIPSALALLIAVAVLYFVGFAPGVFHNSAHDLRHAFAIPCH